MRFRVLGPLEVSGEDGPITLGGRRQRAVLAHLLVRANQLVPVEALIDQVWGEEPPDTARGTLQTYVFHLRQALGRGRIDGHDPGYVLHVERNELDATRFESLLHEARGMNGRPGRADLLREALGLWRGPAYADLAAEPTLAGEIARLDELRLQAVEERVAADVHDGRHATVVGELESLTRDQPLREHLWESLMLALYRSGRSADALGAYQRAREVLADELGVDPSPELQRLHERMLRQDPDLELGGQPLRGYRLLEQIGEGAYGVVHRALQPQVEREVAIKAIHPELANHPDFVRRFEREAQIVARLEHPHIVPLYDYWREPSAAYLVMRYLRGGSLEDLVARGPLPTDQIVTILDQTAAALTAAHQQDVVHRDVKPGNILLDEQGNAYLTDFGVALDVGSPEKTVGSMLRGTPAYLSPEQIRLQPASAQADVYALGIVLYEMLTGEHPFPKSSLQGLLDRHLTELLPPARESRPELPAAVDEVIAKATAKDVDHRFVDALELAAAFRATIEGAATVPVVRTEARNPYKGLRAFLEADAEDFFGRERLTERLVRRLAQDEPAARFLAVVGPSGSGKSSVVRAGLVPALRRGAIRGSNRWFVVEMVPGPHPFRELETALLGIAVDAPPSLMEYLERDELGLVDAVARVLPDPDGELLIVLDQLEEVFTLVPDEAERARFLESIRAAALAPESRIRIITTLRADFFDQPLYVPGFGDLLGARNEAVTPMSPEDMERAIVEPAERAGLIIEPRLLAAMIADITDRPGVLPLMQYALTELAELAERASDNVLTIGAYREIEGVTGALARRAEHLYEALNESGRVACRQLFLRLVTLGEGSEDTRRRVLRSELTPLADDRTMQAVIEAFGHHRLLSFDRDPDTREPTVEIAHEAILRAWARLRDWIDEARDDIRAERQLSAAASDWEAAARDPSFLLRGARLEQASAWIGTATVATSEEDQVFLEVSLRQKEEERAAEEARVAKERALERRSVRRMRGLVAVVTAAALVAGTLTVVAVGQRDRAQREGRVATSRELAAAAAANLNVDPQRSLLLALAAVDVSGEDAALPEVEEALRRALVEDREVLTFQGLDSGLFAISPDGNLIGTRGVGGDAENDPGFAVHDAHTGAVVQTLEGRPGGFTDLAWSPDGSRVAALAPDSTLIAWETESWSSEWTVNLGREISYAGGIGFSPDGRSIAAVGVDGIVSIVDASTGREVQRMEAPGKGFLGVSFSADGTRVAAAPNFGNGPIPIWDIETGRLVLELGDEQNSTFGIAFSPDGREVATAQDDGQVRIWSATTGRELASYTGHQGQAWGVAWSPDGRLVASAADDGVRVWDTSTDQELMKLNGHTGTVWGLRFTPDGRNLVTSGSDGTVRVWDVSAAGSHELLTIGSWWRGFEDVEYSPDGSRLLTIGDHIEQWDAQTGTPLSATVAWAWGGASYDADGTRFVTQGRPVVGEAEPGGELREMELGVDANIWSADFGPDGATVAGGLAGDGKVPGLVYVWDVDTGARIRTLGEVGNSYDHVRGVAYSPDGRVIAGLAASGAVHLWDFASGEELRSWPAQNEGNGDGIAFSPDGTLLATSGAGGAAVWKADSGELVARFRGHAGDVPDVTFSPDGTMVATASEDGTARVWDASTGQELHAFFGHRQGLTSVAFSPDGTTLVTSSWDGTVREYVLDLDELVRIAASRLSRTLSDEECLRYLHESPCPAWVREPSPVEPSDTPAVGLEGTFRITIVASDLDASLTDRQASNTLGDFTLSMFDGAWSMHQVLPNGYWLDGSGSYVVDGDTVTFTELEDTVCFDTSWSAGWRLQGTSLTFTGTTPDPSRPCSDQPTPIEIATRQHSGPGWAEAVFETRSWSRIA